MSLLIYAGLLYLLGISIVLMIKPEIMFSQDGNWKEFGLGRSKNRYTWMPFWLFSILWAILSYLLILIVASHTGIGGVKNNTDITIEHRVVEPQEISMKYPNMLKKKPRNNIDIEEGYYVIDPQSTTASGAPKFVYLGREIPSMIYTKEQTMND